jgi:hypothetical protein
MLGYIGGDEQANREVKSFMGQRGTEIELVKTVNKNLAARQQGEFLYEHASDA